MTEPLWRCRECGSPNLVRVHGRRSEETRRKGRLVFRFRRCQDCGETRRTVELDLLDCPNIVQLAHCEAE